MLYFAYGSNMSIRRIRKRVPSAKFISVCRLKEHQLCFHKKSKDGSSKCDAKYTKNPSHCVFAVLFKIANSEKAELDSAEGLNRGYDEKTVTVIDSNNKSIKAVTYYATEIDPSLKPYCWYKEHVLHGAREHGLPNSYIEEIEKVECIEDPDAKRRDHEMQIYR